MSSSTPDCDALAERVLALLPGAVALDARRMERAPASAGAYALLIGIDASLHFARGSVRGALPPGPLVYAGSARGPGGIRARLARHFRKDKKPHWHVDALTVVARRMMAIAIAGGSECDIVSRLVASGGFVPAIAGFGSSDCRRCIAHLLRPASGPPTGGG